MRDKEGQILHSLGIEVNLEMTTNYEQ